MQKKTVRRMKKKIIKVDKNTFKKIPKFKITLPKCFRDNNFMYCWCGKCKQVNYKLPTDFSVNVVGVELIKRVTNVDE